MAPGAALTALADRACGPAVLGTLTDDQLLGVVAAGRRLAGHAAWIWQAAVAEFAARRREPDPGKATPLGFTLFAPDELAPELAVTANSAELLMAQSRDAARRLPASFALLRDGKITEFPMKIIAESAQCLSDQDAAEADRLIAAPAPGLTPAQLRRLCARIVMMIDPDAARRRRETAAREARVTRFQEYSGNAAISGRELPPDEVLAASQHIDATARALRAAGVPGTLQHLRSLVYLDLLQGTDPLARLTAPARQPGTADQPGTTAQPSSPGTEDQPGTTAGPGTENQPGPTGQSGTGQPGTEDQTGTAGGAAGNATDRTPAAAQAAGDLGDWNDQDEGEYAGSNSGSGGPDGGGTPGPGGRAPVRAVINLLVPAGTLLGWSPAPGEIPGFGLLDPQTTRDMTQAASLHPETRWCVTVIGPDGTATAHGCAPGQHPWHPTNTPPPQDTPPPHASSPPGSPPPGSSPAPGSGPPEPVPEPHPPDPATRTRPPEPHPHEPGPPGPGEASTAEQAAQVTMLLRRLKADLSPIAKDSCDHRHYSGRYVISRKVKHLIKARKSTCIAPCCNRPAADADADHTTPWPDGPSCECNLGAPCRYHHRNKQDPGWHLTQPTPGIFKWRTPSGRTHTTEPTKYTT